MAMQWPVKGAQNRSYRLVLFSVGRCVTLLTFTVVVCFLYMRMGVDRETVQIPAVTQSRNATSTSETKTPVSPSTPEVPDKEATSDAGVKSLDVKPEVEATSDAGVKSLDVKPEVEATSDAGVKSFGRAEKCDGRRLFIYEMPAEFNEELARNCQNWAGWRTMCEDVTNFGFGVNIPLRGSDVLQPPSAWHRTDQFSLEVTFHARLKNHPCVTENADEAALFYIPFYHSLDLIRTLYKPDLAARDRLGGRMVKWLTAQAPWRKTGGHRHVLVLGRIYWDYIRGAGLDTAWGCNLLALPTLSNVTKLLIERSPWKADTVGIPYPTSFHPASEAALRAWQATVRRAKRPQFAAVAGGTRTKKLTGSIRDEVFAQCRNSTKCHQVSCNHEVCATNPQIITRMSLETVFCLQPPGDSPTRKGIFDSLQAGCIPVVFHKQQTIQQYLFHLPGNGLSYSIMIPQKDVTVDHYDVMAHLERIPLSRVKKMQDTIVKLLPQLLYRSPALTGVYRSKDAVDVAIDGLLERFS